MALGSSRCRPQGHVRTLLRARLRAFGMIRMCLHARPVTAAEKINCTYGKHRERRYRDCGILLAVSNIKDYKTFTLCLR
jgi:hypothetical protein